MLTNVLAVQVAKAHQVTAAQVALRWLVQHGSAIVARCSADEGAYMREDLAIFNWTLTDAEMHDLDAAAFANESATKTMCFDF